MAYGRVQSPDLARKANARPTFTDWAAPYIEPLRGKCSIDVIKWHVALLQGYVLNQFSQPSHFVSSPSSSRRGVGDL